ncbi:MAG: bis(5'-nucleosyl)-tetraphosphatase [Nitrososphaeraceae archaeon]
MNRSIIKELSIGAVLFNSKDKNPFFLLLHYNSGHWDFPKGNKEKNETEKETIAREIKEETGIVDIDLNFDFRKDVFYYYKRKNFLVSKEVIYFLAKTSKWDVDLSKEHIGYIWESYSLALNIITYENSRNILRQAFNFINQNISL